LTKADIDNYAVLLMVNSRQILWPRIFAEGAAIVVSILLAFSIEAWWTERQDRANEADTLVRLSAEMAVNIDRLNDPQYRLGFQATADLYNAVEAALENGEDSLDFPTLSLRRSMFVSSFEADTPILDAMIGSGRLELVENTNILSAIADWESTLRSYTELVQRSRLHLDSQFIPALISRADIGPVLARRYEFDLLRSGVPNPKELITIQIDLELKGLLGARLDTTGITSAAVGWTSDAAAVLFDALGNAQPE
jgi:hypothetical protein